MKGKVFVVGLLFGGMNMWLLCLQTGDTLNVATSPKRRVCHVVIINNTM